LGQIKPWQIVLFAVALIGVAASAYYTFGRGRVSLDHKVVLADIESGELFAIDSSGKTIPVPARNPDSGERTLYLVAEEDDGGWYLFARGMNMLRQAGKEPAAIDMETGKVSTQSENIRTITTKDLLARS
jgi:hypothetical protein